MYSNIPKISPGAYIFQRPFLRGLFLEGLIFEGAYGKEGNLPFLLCVSLYSRANSKYKPPYIRRGDLTEGFLHYDFGGAYFRNFTVLMKTISFTKGVFT